MSVIQSIREKYAKWAVIAIALALLGFILTDYFQAKNRMGPGNSTTLGSVNGKKIDYVNFETRLKAMTDREAAQAQQQGREYDEASRQQANERLWNADVEEIIMTDAFKKAGIDVGSKEFNDWLFGQNPPDNLRQQFSDQQGNYDGAAAQNEINRMRRSTNALEREQIDQFLNAVEYSRKLEKYNALLTSSIYYPKWYVEKQNTEAALLAKVAFVAYPYSKIKDSAVTVSDKEIEEYVKKHEDQFRQEEARSVAYVIFDAAPTSADSAAVSKQLSELKPEFETTTEPARFLSRYGSTRSYEDVFVGKSRITEPAPAKDSLFALSKGAVYGPYLSEHTYALAKMIDSRSLPDSVKCRHVLVGSDPSQGGFPDSVASKKMDSIKAAIEGGAPWADMVLRYNPESDGSRQTNGEMTFSSYDIQQPNFAKEFAQFILFDGKKGERKIVKTSFGYHYIEIMDLMNPGPHYKIAYLSKNITASDETERTALDDAGTFASEVQDLKTFDATVAKSGNKLVKREAVGIRPNDATIQGLETFGASRTLVREIYKADEGDVLNPESVGDAKTGRKYVVAIVTDILKEGVQPAYIARPRVERELKDKKKAEQIKQTIGKITTLEAAAAVLQDSIITDDSVRITGSSKIAEAKVLGAIFNPANKGRVVPEAIAANNGVYVLRVDEINSTSVALADVKFQQDQMRGRAKQMQGFYSSPISVLRKTAKINDNRRNFY
jgi:peptidyl-prolyl cis-trans isomerase D